jgi:signal transduction histidine kinase
LRLYNQAFAAIWRLAPAELEGEPHIDDIISACRPLYNVPQEWERAKAAVTAIFAERRAYESQFDRPDGSVIACAALPLPDGGTLITYNDVTDSKRVERALIDRNEALEAADRIKTTFIGHVSYELRTPLTNIIGFTELLMQPAAEALTRKQREYLNDILASSSTLLAIIDDILDLITIDAGALELKLTPVKVAGIVEAAVLGVRDRATRERLNIDVRIDEGAEEFIADEARVRQVLYNLLSNAIGFSKPGDTVTVSAWREAGMMAFAVEDQGVGIPKEEQRRVFDRFESRSQGSKHRGAGLGLSIVKSLVELHGGVMALESEPGRGTRVTVRFPESGTPASAPGSALADAGRTAAQA